MVGTSAIESVQYYTLAEKLVALSRATDVFDSVRMVKVMMMMKIARTKWL